MQIASRSELALAFGAASLAGVALTMGFVPAAATLAFFAPWSAQISTSVAAVLLATAISLTVRRVPKKASVSFAEFLMSLVLPVAIAAAIGSWLFRDLPGGSRLSQWLWIVGIAPIAEELLFRRWCLGQFVRWFGVDRVTSHTNPLSLPVVASAWAFSLWHLQNWATLGTAVVLVQMLATFWLGILLGNWYLRTGKLRYGWIAHVAINAAALALRP